MNYLKLIILSFVVLFSACSKENKNKIHDLDNPEVVAIEFFNALYNEKNIKKAASVCSPTLSRIILHYQSANAVARHLFNMSYDKVEITPDDSGVKVREQFKNSAEITVYFDGYYYGERIKDVKKLLLIQIDNKWIIEKKLKDPF
ncbi:hypothetical protein [Colwellia sp. C1TZA3]|uniref:hypothetical protein n=1 Tax=Colwellia sp. C1TZA3 TaxID=2508879 RepID=UPI0011B981AF|nr:hypothetical protein [Colwellia sp. C1TZA3]TWX65841.1 hypothetical protein ESZ39_14765 [Colwellia sp. C1TZA3]